MRARIIVIAMLTLAGFGALAGRPVSARQEGGTPVASLCEAITRGGTPDASMDEMPGMDGMEMGTPVVTAEPSAASETEAIGVIPDFDLVFIDLMMPHHESAVVMAEIALERAEHPEIIALATNIIAAQTDEIAEMEAWRDVWYPGAAELPLSDLNALMGGAIAGLGDVEISTLGEMDMGEHALALCTIDEPFDLAFIDAMIPHHQSAIAMANAGLENSTHPELMALHQVIIDAQQAEIDQMMTWRAEWYGAAPVATPGM